MIGKKELVGGEKRSRNDEIKKLLTEGKSVKEVAELFNLSEIWVSRIGGRKPTMERTYVNKAKYKSSYQEATMVSRIKKYIIKETENLDLAKGLKFNDMIKDVEERIAWLKRALQVEQNDKLNTTQGLSVT